jgi:hypothetical protein
MSSDNPNPEQAQAKIATALGRLRGDVMPPITSQAAPRLSDQIGAAPLPTASTLRAEPSLGGGTGSVAANLNPAVGNPVATSANSGGNPGPGSGVAGGLPGGGLGNNASGSSYLGSLNATGGVNAAGATAGSQPDLLAGVDMGPPPLGADYPRAEADDGRRKRNRRLVGIAAVVAAVVIVGFWFTTRHRGDVPEITADATPEKVKPADQGGLQVPNQNVQVLENMNGQPKAQSGETVLPPPEQPVAPPAVTDQAAAGTAAAPSPAGGSTQTPADQSAPAAPAVPSVQAPAVPAPATTGSAASTAPAAPAAPAVPAVPTANSSAMTSTPAVPAATTVASAAGSNAAPSTAPTAATTAEPAAKTTTTTTSAAPAGKLRIQLAAVKSEAAAKSTWEKLQKAHPAQLGNLSLMVEKVDKGAEGIFYRVQAGPFSDKNAAKSVCSALSAQGQACILAH